MLSPLVKSDKDNDDDDASSTALGLAANGSDAPTVSTTALNRSVDGSDAPPRNQLLLSACRPMGAICRRKEMPRMLVPLATKWVLLAMVSRLPLAYLLCDNQPFFQFFDKEMRELGSHR